MNKIKIMLGYVCGLLITIVLFLLVVLLILKGTVYNKEYIKNELIKNNYYETVSKEILEEMRDYMTSSGMSDEILENLYTNEEVKNEINIFVDNIYIGKKYEVNTKNIKERLDNNIDSYISKYNLQIISKSNLESFKKDMIDIYKKEISLYNTIDSLINPFYKISNILNYAMLGCIVLLVVLLVIELILKVKYIPGIIMSSGLLLIFTRFVIYNKVDIKNLLIITDYFSIILRSILNNIGHLLLVSSLIMIGFGLVSSFVKIDKKVLKKSK